jgi:hypothetical protein
MESGSGHTLNVSSGGVLFESNHRMRPGAAVELAIVWPALLSKIAGLTLWVTGRVVRVEQNRAAVVIKRHEFRTRVLLR